MKYQEIFVVKLTLRYCVIVSFQVKRRLSKFDKDTYVLTQWFYETKQFCENNLVLR